MNGKIPRSENTENKKNGKARSAKECAYIAVFVALVIAAQLALSAVPGVEVVTVLFVTYAYTFGIKRGMAAATAFAVLRQLVFGFYPVVLVLYLVYYNALAAVFGKMGKLQFPPAKILPFAVAIACFCTVCFTLFDDILTPLWYGFSRRAAKAYFFSSLPFMIPQTVCAGISVGLLFLPLQKTFRLIQRSL